MTRLPARAANPTEALELLERLNQRAKELKNQHLERYGHPWETRVRMANGVEVAVGIGQMLLNILRVAESGQLFARDRKSPPNLVPVRFTTLVGLTPDSDVEFVRKAYEVRARTGIILAAQFQVERMMDDLLRALKLPTAKFEENARTLLNAAGVQAPVRKASWMYLPSLIRNTLHNGGLHQTRNRQITVGDTTYAFRRGRRFEQAGWHHIVHALSAELDVLEELLATPTIQSLGAVPDRFAFLELEGYLPRRDVYPVK